MSVSTKKTKTECYYCIGCKQWFDKYSVVRFFKVDICDPCLALYPGMRVDNDMIAYYKAKEKIK